MISFKGVIFWVLLEGRIGIGGDILGYILMEG